MHRFPCGPLRRAKWSHSWRAPPGLQAKSVDFAEGPSGPDTASTKCGRAQFWFRENLVSMSWFRHLGLAAILLGCLAAADSVKFASYVDVAPRAGLTAKTIVGEENVKKFLLES